ncbi:protein LURP-one-related 8-like [Rutidosis leptorrhynchoides]|uniref:protein LURP-one-related 8-like n=1 Tax=Rutidosis leptorrhynchoides TaxID=125765 RepID=UPI003A9927E6
MTKVYPKTVLPPLVTSDRQRFFSESSTAGRNVNPVILTVWKKSLLFNCDGFTVYDTKGNLVFRVDNYASSNKAEVVLMDCAGHSLLTIRRKRLSLSDSWLVYDGENTRNSRFSATKHVNFLNAKSLAHVSTTIGSPRSPKNGNKRNVAYEIEGSYAQRCCVVYDDKRRRVAEIKRKEAVGGVAFGGDVFRLIVQPEIDPTIAMALVVLLDQMFGRSSRRFLNSKT